MTLQPSTSRFCATSSRAALCSALVILAAGTAQAQDCAPRIADEFLVEPGTLTMATSPTLPPMAYADQNGTLMGLRIELGVEVAKRLCLEPKYISTEYATMIPGLQGDRWDMVNAGLFVTDARREILLMIPYESLAISISTVTGDTSISEIDDLAGKTVSADIGGYAERKMKDLNAEFEARGLEPMTINLFDNYATVYQALRAGQVQAAVSIDPVAKQYQDRGEFTQAIAGMYATPGSFAFISPEVAEGISTALKEMKADGAFDALMDSYGVVPAPGDLSYLPLIQ
ncbi:transporter substrate-binding domain-containing protein [Frigidibacter sp.]|uniref:transporter substrate-binding domain-containing protein n=1 Tax=Frigidibacter sp. TaxID=2586418 RepID=UPI002735A320|nr:transporter substrate-binding domain-containing protein [Frigidibacter sp.]MDP3339265.1 transporter substrate-binding domain-containing protein [Frigidibacter sp.]